MAAALSAGQSSIAMAKQDAKPFTHFTKDNVIAALTGLGVKDAKAGKQGTLETISFTHNKLSYALVFRLCDGAKGGCRGLLQVIFFRTNGKSYSTATMNSFNQSYAFAAASLVSGDKVALSRYLMSDGGMMPDNLKQNFKVFMEMPAELISHLSKAGANLEAAAPSAPVNAIPAIELASDKATDSGAGAEIEVLSGVSAGNELGALGIPPAAPAKP